MKAIIFCGCLLASVTVGAGVRAAEADGWRPLFNANDLAGWVNVNGAPETWSIRDGVISCTGAPIAALRTEKQYENFELELEWRHLKPAGNAGIFVWASPLPAVGTPFLRAIEVQVLDNAYGIDKQNVWFTTHGDVFPIHGATMTPMRPQTHQGDKSRCFPIEFRSKPSPEWNHYRIVAQNGSIRLSVNGKEVSGGDQCQWRKGYLGLESEGSPTEWRHLRIKELPPTGATTADSAPTDHGWRPLYNGVDLRGWKSPDPNQPAPANWKPADWVLQSAAAPGRHLLWSADDFEDVDVIVDAKIPADPEAPPPALALRSPDIVTIPITGPPGSWQRRIVRLHQGTVDVTDHTGQSLHQSRLPADAPVQGPIALIAHGPAESHFANIFVRTPPPGQK